MVVYVLHHYWNTPDNEGNEILGAYWRKEGAQTQMQMCMDALKQEFDPNVWEEDYTWEDDYEVHLGFDSHTPSLLATIYCWKIVEVEVQ